MILRIDDTDIARNTQQSLDSIFDGLNWLELGWDEQYRQSERVALPAGNPAHLSPPGADRCRRRWPRGPREIRGARR